jgi:DNA-binding protein H-NS
MTSPDVLDTLDTADEGTLLEMIERAHALLAQRQQSRKHETMEKAAADLEAAAISADEFVEYLRRRGKTKKAPATKPKMAKGRYVNPADPTQSYELGRGRPPQWFRALDASGQLPSPDSPDTP